MRSLTFSVLTGLVWLTVVESAWCGDVANWPQFRGPQGDGQAGSPGLPVEWSERKNVRWKQPIPGIGWSSPVIMGGQIWLTTAVEEGKSLHAICVEEASGKILHDIEVFRVKIPVAIHNTNSHASPTPVIEPGRVYVNFGTSGTACIDTATGKILWTNTELSLDHEVGPGSSPILYENLLILTCDGYNVRYVVALDKSTGKVVWNKPRPGELNKSGTINKAFSTPLMVRVDSNRQLAVSPSAQQVVAYEPKTGEVAWLVRYDGFSNVPRPVVGWGKVFVCTGYPKPEIWAIRLDGKGDVSNTHVDWVYKGQVPAKPSPIIVDTRLYMIADSTGVLTCLDCFTGKEVWKKRLDSGYSASPICADGLLFFCQENGVTHVIEPGPRFHRVAENHLNGRQMASPAVSGKALYLRTDSHLYRIEK